MIPAPLDEMWQIKKLDDIVDIDTRFLAARTPKEFPFYYIDITAASEGKLRIPSETLIFRDAPTRARKVIRRHDILMSMVRPNLKAFACFDHEHREDCFVASTGFAVLTAKNGTAPRFVLYSLLSDFVSQQIENSIIGSNYPAINISTVKSLQIPTPTTEEQTKIAEILSALDRAIEQTEALIAKQQRVNAGLMQDLLVLGIDKSGKARCQYTNTSIEKKPSHEEHTCHLTKLSNCAAENSPICYGILMPGTAYPNGVPVIKVKDIKNGLIESGGLLLTDPKIDKAYKRSRLRKHDLLITIRGTTGRVAAVPTELDGANITQDTARIRIRDDHSVDYFYFLLQSRMVQEQVALHTIGQAVKGINIASIRSIDVSVPSKEEQIEIAKHLRASQKYLEELRLHCVKLYALKRGLMQDLLTGKRRVTPLLSSASTQ